MRQGRRARAGARCSGGRGASPERECERLCADRQATGRHPRSSRVGQGSGGVLRRLARRYAPACAAAPKRARRWRVPGQEAAGSGPSWLSKDRTHTQRRPRTSRSPVSWPGGAATLANAALISLLAALHRLVFLRRQASLPRAKKQIRLMTNSHKSQSEKLATGGGRETTAEEPDNNWAPARAGNLLSDQLHDLRAELPGETANVMITPCSKNRRAKGEKFEPTQFAGACCESKKTPELASCATKDLFNVKSFGARKHAACVDIFAHSSTCIMRCGKEQRLAQSFF